MANQVQLLDAKLVYPCKQTKHHTFEGDATYDQIKKRLTSFIRCDCGKQHKAGLVTLSPITPELI